MVDSHTPDRYMILNSCHRKEGYRDRSTAIKQLVNFKQSGKFKARRRDASLLRPYHCAVCGMFHLGHDKPPKNGK